jgi:hypothetical protein
MTTDPPTPPESPTFTAIFQQNWDNVRSIKSELFTALFAYRIATIARL